MSSASIPPKRRRRSRAILLGILTGCALVVALGLVLAMRERAAALPKISLDDVTAAESRWREHGPASYDLDLMLGGNQPGPVHLEVRDGQVTAMTRNGVIPSQRRTWVYWTVPEQFETIRQDFDSAENPAGPFGASPGAETVIRAEFDPDYGFPRHYERRVLGAHLDVSWEVTRFEARP